MTGCGRSVACILLMACAAIAARAQEWSYYGGTQAGMRYSALDQIKRRNVSHLGVAWSYRTGEIERLGETLAPTQSFENTPTLVDGSLIVCTPLGRLIALDPATGQERWVFDPKDEPQASRATLLKCRGVSPWRDPDAAEAAACSTRLLYGTWAFKVYAIDAHNGKPCTDFGEGGVVSFDPGRRLDPDEFIQVGSPPAIIGDLASARR